MRRCWHKRALKLHSAPARGMRLPMLLDLWRLSRKCFCEPLRRHDLTIKPITPPTDLHGYCGSVCGVMALHIHMVAFGCHVLLIQRMNSWANMLNPRATPNKVTGVVDILN